LFRISENDRLRASLYLPESQVRRFLPGQKVNVVSLSDPSASAAPGTVRLVNPVADPVTNLRHVTIEVPGSAGMVAGGSIRVEPGGAALAKGAARGNASGSAILPLGAYVERRGDSFLVVRVEDGRARWASVELGDVGPDGFDVVSGLAPGNLVVARGQLPPREGAAVLAKVVAPGSTREP